MSTEAIPFPSPAKRILILEDDVNGRMPFFRIYLNAHVVQEATNLKAFVYCLEETLAYDYIFMDHDLEMSGPNCGDGREAVKFISDDSLVRTRLLDHGTKFIIHSLNSQFSPDMVRELESMGFPVCRRTYAWHDGVDLRAISGQGWPMANERWLCRYPAGEAGCYEPKHRAQLVSQQGTLMWGDEASPVD